MKKSLLDITQEILSDMDSDEVNSIDETVEATQVAEIVRSTYFAMISNRNWPHTRRSVNLVASGDASYPTHMRVEEDFKELCFINYDKASHGETRKKFRVSIADFEARRITPNFRFLLKHEIAKARANYASAEIGLMDLPPAAAFTVKVASRVYGNILNQIEKMDYQVFKARAMVPKWKKLWID